MTRLALDGIKVGARHRRDFGDIAALAESLADVGLLHPVVVTADHRLVAGARRLAAARSLGWEDIDVTVAANLSEAATLLRAESDENTCRKDFTPSEAAAIRRARAELLAPLAEKAKAQAPGRPRGMKDSSAKLAGETRKVAAVGTGYSGSTLDKVDHVEAVATDTSKPASVRAAARRAREEMNTTGKVDRAYRDVKYAEQTQAEQTLADAIEKRLPGAAVERERSALRARCSRLISAVAEIQTLPPDVVASLYEPDELAPFLLAAKGLRSWADKVGKAARPGLRAVGDR